MTVAVSIAPRLTPDQDQELWLGIPKGGKTLRGSDEKFFGEAGFITRDQRANVDDYRLTDGPDFQDVGLRAFIKRPKDALKDILRGGLDAAIVGRDVLKEVNSSLPGDAPKLREVLDLDMSSCVLSLAVRMKEQSKFTCVSDFNDCVLGTKYEDTLREWLKTKNVAAREIIVREGGIESLMMQYKDMAAVADIIESGKSLAENGLMPLGVDAQLWEKVQTGRTRFADLPASILAKIPGVLTMSRAVLVRTPNALSAAKENAIFKIAQCFYAVAGTAGCKPRLKIKAPRSPAPVSRPVSENTFPGHLGARW